MTLFGLSNSVFVALGVHIIFTFKVLAFTDTAIDVTEGPQTSPESKFKLSYVGSSNSIHIFLYSLMSLHLCSFLSHFLAIWDIDNLSSVFIYLFILKTSKGILRKV